MNIRQIKAFHATFISGSVSNAAVTLGLTQSAVSKLLHNLENTLNYQLFDRVNGRVIPTAEAQYLFQEVDDLLSQMNRLGGLFGSAKKLSQNQIKIGSLAGPSNFFIPYVLGKYLIKHKNLRASVITRGSPAISDNIACQALDIGLIDASQTSLNYDIHPVPVSYFCAIPANDPLSSKPYITAKDLHGKPLISLPKGQAFYEKMEYIFKQAGALFNVVHEIFVHLPAIAMVNEGLGYAFVDTLNMWSYEQYLGQKKVIFKPFKPLVQEELALITPTLRPIPESVIELVSELESEILAIEKYYETFARD